MAFSVLAIRTGEEPRDHHYPDPGYALNTVELTGADTSPRTYSATGITINEFRGGTFREAVRVSDIDLNVFVTGSRIAVACSKYDKGGGWVGWGVAGFAIAVTANAVSKARAARRRRGRMLVGHVRYEWLETIVAKDRTGMFGRNSLRLLFSDPLLGVNLMCVDLQLGKHEPASALASDIAARARRHRIGTGRSVSSVPGDSRPTVLPDGSTRFTLPDLVPAHDAGQQRILAAAAEQERQALRRRRAALLVLLN